LPELETAYETPHERVQYQEFRFSRSGDRFSVDRTSQVMGAVTGTQSVKLDQIEFGQDE
jgi:hypothetical protein